VATFWNNIDITGMNGGNVSMRPSDDLEDLTKASQEIKKSFPDLPNFTAKWIFVVSWHAVTYFHQGDKVSDNIVRKYVSPTYPHTYLYSYA